MYSIRLFTTLQTIYTHKLNAAFWACAGVSRCGIFIFHTLLYGSKTLFAYHEAKEGLTDSGRGIPLPEEHPLYSNLLSLLLFISVSLSLSLFHFISFC